MLPLPARKHFVCLLPLALVLAACSRGAAQREPGTYLTYDVNGNIETCTDPADNTVAYSYDALDRLVKVRYPGAEAVSFTYDPVGRRTTMHDASGTTRYAYDIHDRVTSITDPAGHALSYAYDPRGLPLRMTYPDGGAIAWAWNADGLLVAVTDVEGKTQYRYDPAGRFLGRVLPNGVTTAAEYDAAGRLVSIRHSRPNGNLVLGIGYELNAVGDRIKAIRTDAGGTRRETTYDYDALSRLVRAKYADGEQVAYEYDLSGNRTSMTSSRTGTTRYTYDDRLGRLLRSVGPAGTTTFRYDANGSLDERRHDASDGPTRTVSYRYDYGNRLLALSDGDAHIRFRYDGDGRRLAKVVNDRTMEYTSHGAELPQVVMETPDSGEATRYLLGNERIGERRGGRTLYYLEDGLGSIVGATDARGQLVGTTEYDAFGAPRPGSTLTLAFGFAGEQVDRETGLVYLRSRYYDPTLGRFLTADPHPPSPYDPRSLNPYIFALNNPVNLADPSGLEPRRYTIGKSLVVEPAMAFWGNLADQAIAEATPGNWVWQGAKATGFELMRVLASGALSLERNVYVVMEPEAPWTRKIGSFAILAAEVILPTLSSQTLKVSLGAKTLPRWPVLQPFRGRLGFWPSQWHLYWPGMEAAPACKSFRIPFQLINQVKDLSDVAELLGAALEGRRGTRTERPSQQDVAYGPWAPKRLIDDDTYRKFPRRFPDDGDGGGGGGSVGGISLDRAATLLADLRDIVGVTYDQGSGRIILIGREDMALPPMDIDDLAVAILSIYSGQVPSMSIEPCNPGSGDGCMKVLYNGRFRVPTSTGQTWVMYDRAGRRVEADAPATFGTRFGSIIFEADRYLKTSSLGADNLDPTRPFRVNDVDFPSELELMVSRRSVAPAYHRMWFLPDEMVVDTSADGRSMIFRPVHMRTEARFVRFGPSGQMLDVPGHDPAVDEFVANWNEHYNEVAREKRELAELTQLAKIVGVVRWMHDNNVPVDLAWIGRHELAADSTPVATRAVQRWSGNVGIYGGVEFAKNLHYARTGRRADAADALEKEVHTSRPSLVDVAWNVRHDGTTLRAVALNLEGADVVGGRVVVETDVNLPVASDLDIEFTRRHDSANLAPGTLGRGWTTVMPQLSIRLVRAHGEAEAYYTYSVLTLANGQIEFAQSSDGALRPTEIGSPYVAVGLTGRDRFEPLSLRGYSLRPGLPGRAATLEGANGLSERYTGFVAVRGDGVRLAFDPSGRIVGVRSRSGMVADYTYEGDRLISIASGRRSIRLGYDRDGRVTRINASDGRRIVYTYDRGGRLAAVKTGEGRQLARYAYDEDGRVTGTSVGASASGPRMAYDALGRVTRVARGPGDVLRVSYDDRRHIVSVRDTSGASWIWEYDDANHLRREIGPDSGAIAYEYDSGGRPTRVTDRRGSTTLFAYDVHGLLREIVSPLGDRTRFLNYDAQGVPHLVVDPAHRLTMFDCNAAGDITRISSGMRLASESDSDGFQYAAEDPAIVEFQYDGAGNVSAFRDAAGSVTSFGYTESGELSSVRLPGGGTATYTWDGGTHLMGATDPSGRSIAVERDRDGRATALRTAVGTTAVSYADADSGTTVLLTDPLGRRWTYCCNASGLPVRITDPIGAVTRYGYDARGNLTCIRDQAGRWTVFGYDASGRVVSRVVR